MKRFQSIGLPLTHMVKVLFKEQNDSLFHKIAEAPLLVLKRDLSMTALKRYYTVFRITLWLFWAFG